MKKIISIAICACVLVSALCMTSSAHFFRNGNPCWEGLVYGQFAEQGRRSAEDSGKEFTGRIMLEFGDKVPYDKMLTIKDFPGLEIEKVENLVDIISGACNHSFITLKDKSYDSVINALEYLENYKYSDFVTVHHSCTRRDAEGIILVLADEDFSDAERKAVTDAEKAWYEKYGSNWNNAYEGLFDCVQAELKNCENLLDKYDRRMLVDDFVTTYRYQIIAEIATGDGIVHTEYFNGDADGDTLVNIQDAVRILKYSAHWEGVDVELGADFNMDNVVNISDCIEILKAIAG